MRALLHTLVPLTLVMAAGMQLSEAAPSDLSDDDMTRLMHGEILLQTIHADKSGGAARVTALFHSNADAVWDIIGYCKYEFIYIAFCTTYE